MSTFDGVNQNKCLGDVVSTLVSCLPSTTDNALTTSVSPGMSGKMWSSRVQQLYIGEGFDWDWIRNQADRLQNLHWTKYKFTEFDALINGQYILSSLEFHSPSISIYRLAAKKSDGRQKLCWLFVIIRSLLTMNYLYIFISPALTFQLFLL